MAEHWFDHGNGEEFLVLLFFYAQLLLSLFNCLYLNPGFFHILFFLKSLPDADAAGKVKTEWLSVAQLLDGVKPQHSPMLIVCLWRL